MMGLLVVDAVSLDEPSIVASAGPLLPIHPGKGGSAGRSGYPREVVGSISAI
jgi:hypothetical protein